MSKVSVEIIHGKRSKYEIFRSAKLMGGYEFSITKDGKPWKAGYRSLQDAVRTARHDN